MTISKTKRNRTNNLLKKLAARAPVPKKGTPLGKAYPRKCTRCGCDDNHACAPAGCYWVKGLVDVCSECATGGELRGDAEAKR